MLKNMIKFKMASGCSDLAPAKAHPDDAAYDLKARTDVELAVGKSTLVPTGLFLELPVGFEAQVRPRSGLALKHNLSLAAVELVPAEELSETQRGAGGFGSTGIGEGKSL